MKALLLAATALFATAAHAQTVPIDPSAPVRGGNQGQTTVPPLNPALNQSTIQGPPQVQRTLTNRDAQPSRLTPERGFAPAATPEQSPTARPDIRETPLIRQGGNTRQSSDVVPTRNAGSRSDNLPQR